VCGRVVYLHTSEISLRDRKIVSLFQESYLAHTTSLANLCSMLGVACSIQPVCVAFRSTRCRVVRNDSSSSDTLRLFSSWVTPSQRRKRVGVGSPYYQPHPERSHGASSHQSINAVARRPLVNGKSVAFHVKDLPLQQTSSESAQSTYLDWKWHGIHVPSISTGSSV
jgi:hypothetical protein